MKMPGSSDLGRRAGSFHRKSGEIHEKVMEKAIDLDRFNIPIIKVFFFQDSLYIPVIKGGI